MSLIILNKAGTKSFGHGGWAYVYESILVNTDHVVVVEPHSDDDDSGFRSGVPQSKICVGGITFFVKESVAEITELIRLAK